MRTYVRVDATSTTDTFDFTKNHTVINNNADDGYIMMQAAMEVIYGHAAWKTRIIAVDDNGVELWSKDYKLQHTSLGGPLSSTPFAICPNTQSNGYVIAGIWQQPGTPYGYKHKGIQSPYYLEIDDNGVVVQANRQVMSINNSGFAPLSIIPDDDGYAVAGVRSSDMECVSCGRKDGLMVKLDLFLNETFNKNLYSTFLINSNSTMLGKDSYFDALNTIVKVPIENGGGYLVGGAITGSIDLDTGNNTFGMAGQTDFYIARVDDNFDVVWDASQFSYDTVKVTHQEVLSDLVYDSATNKVYALINYIGGPLAVPGEVGRLLELGFTSGNKLFYRYIDCHTHYEDAMLTNIFVDSNSIYIGGFAHNSLPKTVLGSQGMLEPLYFEFDKTTHNTQKGYILKSENYHFSQWPAGEYYDGYLGIYYKGTNNVYSDMVYLDVTTVPGILVTYKMDKIYNPIIYYPSAWCMNDANVLQCIVPHRADNLMYTQTINFSYTPQYYPALYLDTDSTECNYFSDPPCFLRSDSTADPYVFQDILTLNYSELYFINDTINSDIIGSCVLLPPNNEAAPNGFKNTKAEMGLTQQSENIFHIMDKGNLDNLTNDAMYNVKIYSLNGKLLYSGKSVNKTRFVNLKSGMYVYTIENDKRSSKGKVVVY